ncbi:hypothetical protein GCM10010182_59960 [Actinomadura cremea]|nr:hypothetical protein GCM10010182_59960 [Actinomadura cremea]
MVHGLPRCAACGVPLRTYVYRFRPDSERCVSLVWCPACRTYAGAMVHVPREEELPDALAPLDGTVRERLRRSETELIGHIDRLIRRGAWPPA